MCRCVHTQKPLYMLTLDQKKVRRVAGSSSIKLRLLF